MDVLPFMQVHAFLQHSTGERVFVNPEQYCVGEVQSINILAFLQKHDQPEVMGVAFKMLIFALHALMNGLLLDRSGTGFLRRLCRLSVDQPFQQTVEHLFPLMPEGRMAEIMCDRCTFHHLRINDQSGVLRCPCFDLRIRTQQAFGRFPGNLRHFQRVGQPGPVIIAGSGSEYL